MRDRISKTPIVAKFYIIFLLLKILQRSIQFRLYSLQNQSMLIGTFHCPKKRLTALNFTRSPPLTLTPEWRASFKFSLGNIFLISFGFTVFFFLQAYSDLINNSEGTWYKSLKHPMQNSKDLRLTHCRMCEVTR